MYEEVFYYGISGIDITDDNSILALACYDHFTYVYSLSQTDSFDFEEKHSC